MTEREIAQHHHVEIVELATLKLQHVREFEFVSSPTLQRAT